MRKLAIIFLALGSFNGAMAALIDFSEAGKEQPTSYEVDKGSVFLVKDNQDFWIRYNEKYKDDLKVEVVDGKARISCARDNVQLSINVNKLAELNLSLENGVAHIYDLAPNSTIKITNGIIESYLCKNKVGALEAKVINGAIKNKSRLNTLNDAKEPLPAGHNLQLKGHLPAAKGAFVVENGSITLR